MKTVYALCAMSIILFGCASARPIQYSSGRDHAEVWFAHAQEIMVEEAYISGSSLYFRYSAMHAEIGDREEFYCRTRWNEKNFSSVYRGLSAELEFMSREQWSASLPQQRTKVSFLSSQEWRAIRTEVIRQIVPQEGEGAVLVRTGQSEKVFFYNEKGEPVVTDLKNKPPEILLEKTFSPKDIEESSLRALKEYVQSKNFSDHILIGLLDAVEFGSPFSYVDLEQGRTVILDFPVSGRQPYRGNVYEQGLKATQYAVVQSHVFGLAGRPISYALRLVNLSKDLVYDALTLPVEMVRPRVQNAPVVGSGPLMDLTDFEEYLSRLTKRQPYLGRLEFLVGGDQFFSRLIDQIQAAKESIDIRLFIFDNDDYAVEVADILKKKSLEGVRVRVLVDSIGQVMGEGQMPPDLPPGFVPPHSMARYLQEGSKISVRLRPSAWFQADHTKTIVIDQKTGFTGGMNIGREYRYDWHDMMMEVQGPILSEMIYEFKIAWAHAGSWGDLGLAFAKKFKRHPQIKGEGIPVRLLYTRVNNPELYRAQLEAIRRAGKYIWINNAYFSDNTIINDLIRARERGVDVRVILPSAGNHSIMNKSNAVTANLMFRNGIKVYFYPGMSHIKAAVYDGWMCAGSANFDKLSLRDNLELNVATSNPETVARFKEELFQKDFERSKMMIKPIISDISDFVANIVAQRL